MMAPVVGVPGEERLLRSFLCLLLCCITATAAAPVALAGRHPQVHFEPNLGQVKGRTQWIAQAGGSNIYLAGNEAMLGAVHMRLVNAANVRLEGLEPGAAYSNYFLGRTAEQWITGVPHYARVRAREVYPGIDVVYYGAGGALEYDFVLAPNADPDQIELAFDHARVWYAGIAPGLPEGVLQFNVELPGATVAGSVPIVISVGEGASQKNVSIFVR